MRFDTLHFALLVAIVLLAVYVARGYGLFKEGNTPCDEVPDGYGKWKCKAGPIRYAPVASHEPTVIGGGRKACDEVPDGYGKWKCVPGPIKYAPVA